MKSTHVKQLINPSPNYKKEPDFPCLADEIVEPRPDISIKVTAFTESKKVLLYLFFTWCEIYEM